jgi:hypothetical protein
VGRIAVVGVGVACRRVLAWRGVAWVGCIGRRFGRGGVGIVWFGGGGSWVIRRVRVVGRVRRLGED